MKNTFYFPHDNNAKDDQKILMLRGQFGLEGYALYFMCLESMAQDGRGYIYCEAMAGLSVGYGTNTDNLKAVLDYCLKVGLFKKNDVGIFSERMKLHKDFRNKLSKYGKKGAEKRWQNDDYGGNSPPISIPNAKERKGKERKTKERKTKEIKGKETDNIGFDTFWEKYPKKVAKEKAISIWSKISPNETLLNKILSAIENQSKSDQWIKDNGKFIPHPTTWLNQKRWEDEILKGGQNGKITGAVTAPAGKQYPTGLNGDN